MHSALENGEGELSRNKNRIVDTEYTWERMLEFVRVLNGCEPIKRPQAESNRDAQSPIYETAQASGSRKTPMLSEKTYPKHPDMSMNDYWALNTLLLKRDQVKDLLQVRNQHGEITADALEAIWQEDSNPHYRMMSHVERFLNRERGAIWRVGKLCGFYLDTRPQCKDCGKKSRRPLCPSCGAAMPVAAPKAKKSTVMKFRTTEEWRESIREQAAAAGMEVAEYIRMRLESAEKSKEK